MNELRIKYVGFIAKNTNYIIDLDNKEITYKEANSINYKKIFTKVSSFVNPVNQSMIISFKLYLEDYVAEIEVFANCIDKCVVTLTNSITHTKEILANEFYNFDYFRSSNLLDIDGNVSTYIDYSEVFGITEDELVGLFTYESSINFIKRMVENIHNEKDIIKIIRDILLELKDKMSPTSR